MSAVTISPQSDQLVKYDHLLNQTNTGTNGHLSDEVHSTKTEENGLELQNEINTISSKDDNVSRQEENVIIKQTEIIPINDHNHHTENIQVQTQVIKRIDTVKTEVIITKREECLTIQDYNQLADQSNGNTVVNNETVIKEINGQNNITSTTMTNVEEESVEKIENTTTTTTPIKTVTTQDNLSTGSQPMSNGTIIPIQVNQHQTDSNGSLNDQSVHQTTQVKETISTTTQQVSQSQIKTEISDDPTDLSDLKDCQFNSPSLRKIVEEFVGEIPKKPKKDDSHSSTSGQNSTKKSMRDIILERKELILRTRAIKSAAKSPDGEGKRQKSIDIAIGQNDEKNKVQEDSETSPLSDSYGRQTFHELLRNIAPKTKKALGLDKHVDNVKTILLRGGKYGYGMVLAENEDNKVYISHVSSLHQFISAKLELYVFFTLIGLSNKVLVIVLVMVLN